MLLKSRPATVLLIMLSFLNACFAPYGYDIQHRSSFIPLY